MGLKRVMEENVLMLFDGSKKVLSITEELEDNNVNISLEGRLSSETVHDFQDEMMALAILGMDLCINMEKVTYLSSACSQAFLKIQQKMDKLGNGSMLLKNLPVVIYKELESTGMSELLMIEE